MSGASVVFLSDSVVGGERNTQVMSFFITSNTIPAIIKRDISHVSSDSDSGVTPSSKVTIRDQYIY